MFVADDVAAGKCTSRSAIVSNDCSDGGSILGRFLGAPCWIALNVGDMVHAVKSYLGFGARLRSATGQHKYAALTE